VPRATDPRGEGSDLSGARGQTLDDKKASEWIGSRTSFEVKGCAAPTCRRRALCGPVPASAPGAQPQLALTLALRTSA
jgi:hypothetical protein